MKLSKRINKKKKIPKNTQKGGEFKGIKSFKILLYDHTKGDNIKSAHPINAHPTEEHHTTNSDTKGDNTKGDNKKGAHKKDADTAFINIKKISTNFSDEIRKRIFSLCMTLHSPEPYILIINNNKPIYIKTFKILYMLIKSLEEYKKYINKKNYFNYLEKSINIDKNIFFIKHMLLFYFIFIDNEMKPSSLTKSNNINGYIEVGWFIWVKSELVEYENIIKELREMCQSRTIQINLQDYKFKYTYNYNPNETYITENVKNNIENDRNFFIDLLTSDASNNIRANNITKIHTSNFQADDSQLMIGNLLKYNKYLDNKLLTENEFKILRSWYNQSDA